MRRLPATCVIAVLVLAGCGGAPAPDRRISTGDTGNFVVSSPAFADGARIPPEQVCPNKGGANQPPPLAWRGVPDGAVALALVVDYPDAPGEVYVHWVVSGIPADADGITGGRVPRGALMTANSGGDVGYLGPCPPEGSGVHHYRFRVLALFKPLLLGAHAAAEDAVRRIEDAAIGEAQLVGTVGG